MRISQKNENCQGQDYRQSPPPTRTQEAHHGLKPRLSFPKSARILYRGHYSRVIKNGKKMAGKVIVMDYRTGHAQCAKLGITVSKRYGKAHDRNRFKRMVREAFRSIYPTLPVHLEVNVLPRYPLQPISLQAILNDLHLLC